MSARKDDGENKVIPLRREKPCPQCGRPLHERFRPFCSKRCADLDLGKWLGGDYRVPGEKAPPEGGEGRGEDDETP